MDTITNNVLISNGFANFTRSISENDGKLDIYIHAEGGNILIQGGPYGSQVINSLSIPNKDQQFILKTLYELEQELNLTLNLTVKNGVNEKWCDRLSSWWVIKQ